MKNLFLFFFLTIIGLSSTFAKEGIVTEDSTKLIHRPGQITFFPPMGTNGLEAGRVVNNISINMFAGYQGGLDGVEFAGFANVLRYDMRGAQFAGFGNNVMGTTHGAQFSGFYNVNRKYTFGAQFSGFANVVADSVDAFQAAGFVNLNTGRTNGTQVAGFTNMVVGNVQGGQVAGFLNATTGDLKGIQASGFTNIVTGDTEGAQIAGFANVASGDVKGFQASGFINVAKKLSGVQLGFINFADTIEDGIAIGFLSFSRNGYLALELESNETFFAMAHIKTGTERFYNIFSAGIRPKDDKMNWAYGYGVGTLFPLSSKLDMNLDLQSFQIVDEGWNDLTLNLHNRLKANVNYNVSDKVTLFAGPSFNVLVSDREDENGNLVGSDLAPSWTMTNENTRNTNVQTYIGFNAGIKF